MTDKKSLSERDLITLFIQPSIIASGWSMQKLIREEVFFADGRLVLWGTKTTRGERRWSYTVLYHKPNIPIATIEARGNNHSVGSGLQQALNYVEILDISVAFSSNGDGFV